MSIYTCLTLEEGKAVWCCQTQPAIELWGTSAMAWLVVSLVNTNTKWYRQVPVCAFCVAGCCVALPLGRHEQISTHPKVSWWQTKVPIATKIQLELLSLGRGYFTGAGPIHSNWITSWVKPHPQVVATHKSWKPEDLCRACSTTRGRVSSKQLLLFI